MNALEASLWPDPIVNDQGWTRGIDVEIVARDDDQEPVVMYIREAQDRMDRRDT